MIFLPVCVSNKLVQARIINNFKKILRYLDIGLKIIGLSNDPSLEQPTVRINLNNNSKPGYQCCFLKQARTQTLCLRFVPFFAGKTNGESR